MRTSTTGRRARSAAVLTAFAAFATAPALAQDEETRKLLEDADRATEATKPPAAKPDLPGGKDEDAAALRAAADAKVEEDRGLLGRALTTISERGNEFNPRLVVAGDVLGRLATARNKTLSRGASPDDRVSLREAELDLRASIDPYANGVMILAIGEEDAQTYAIDIEEGYLTLEQLPWHLRARLGRYRVPFGRMNTLHTHDLPQALQPYAIQDLFGPEGYNDNGAMLSWLTPLPIPVELSAHVLQGENAQVLTAARSTQPAYLGRAEAFFQLGDVTWLSLGGAYLFGYGDVRGTPERPHHANRETHLVEADLLFKWHPDSQHSLVFVAEAYRVLKRDRLRTLENDPVGTDAAGNPVLATSVHRVHDSATGAFTFVQYQLPRLTTHLPFADYYLGVRGDWSDFDEARAHHEQWAASVWLSAYTTEFLRFRVGFEHRERLGRGGGGPDAGSHPSPNDTLFFEVTFVFGSHPAEPFWVNK